MAGREFHYRWTYELKATPEQLWPFVADTNRFNRDTGLPAVELRQGEETGNSRRLRLFKFGIPIEWEEQPFEWVRPSRFGVVRKYLSGPVSEMRVLAELKPRGDGGTELSYEIWVSPKNLLGLFAIPLQVGILSKRSFGAAFMRYDREAASMRPPLYSETESELTPGGRERLRAMTEQLAARGASEDVVQKLSEMIGRADDASLARIRPHALADYWGFPRRLVLETCLWATRVGLLDLQWDIICPMCRGAGESAASLRDVSAQAHCASCHIDFTANFERSVELTFRPNPSVRKVEAETYCVGGPQVTPHIVAQQLLPPGAERCLTLPLEPGRYRLRAAAHPGEQYLLVSDEGAQEVCLRAGGEGWAEDEVCLCASPSLRLENATESEQMFVLERTAWGDQAATAAEVTSLQVFRDLFATEALRPGERISVGSLTVLFTDLKNSTRFYREVGDAAAFGRVLNHFDVLRESIAAEEGALVKTIGDAVMAVFRRPASALRAMLGAQKTLASPPEGMTPLALKAGLHTGPCIAVTLNDRLDYFGSTVNMAARLEGLSTGNDVVVSSTVHADPEVRDLLYGPGARLTAEPFEMRLKGFDEENFKLWRVTEGMRAEG
jgi:class 3 adenylate cyclase/ligand-binding SRPBCC domain-containing protein